MGRLDLNKKEDLLKLRERVNWLCSDRFYWLDPEDAFQSVCLKFLERPNSKSTVEQMIIDVMRTQHGRKGSTGYKGKMRIRSAVNYEDHFKHKTSEENPYLGIDNKLDLEKLLSAVDDEKALQILELIYVRGWKQCEVAKFFNVSATMISFREKWAFEDIREEFSI